MFYSDIDSALDHAQSKAMTDDHSVTVMYHFDRDEYAVTNDPGQFGAGEANEVAIVSPDGNVAYSNDS